MWCGTFFTAASRGQPHGEPCRLEVTSNSLGYSGHFGACPCRWFVKICNPRDSSPTWLIAWIALGFVIAIIGRRIRDMAGATEIVTLVEVVDCANVFGEKKIQGPVKCDTNLLVQAGQFAEIDRPPHPPREEAGEIETKNPRDARAATNRSQQPDSREGK
jgi:hypothetical protein